MTEDQYLADKAQLDELNRRIDETPGHAKPVFEGICRLHNRVKRYEREHKA